MLCHLCSPLTKLDLKPITWNTQLPDWTSSTTQPVRYDLSSPCMCVFVCVCMTVPLRDESAKKEIKRPIETYLLQKALFYDRKHLNNRFDCIVTCRLAGKKNSLVKYIP